MLPGAHEALAAVRAAGQRAVVITAKHPVSAEPSLRAAGLAPDELFTLVHGPEKAAVLRRLRAVAYVGRHPAGHGRRGAGRRAGGRRHDRLVHRRGPGGRGRRGGARLAGRLPGLVPVGLDTGRPRHQPG